MARCKYCKDCIENQCWYCEEDIEEIHFDDKCEHFRDKNRFVEIPCYCKECEYYDKGNGECQNSRIYFSDGSHMYVDEDFYCAMGERKCDK